MKFRNEHGSAWTRMQNDSGEPKRKLHSVNAEDVANDVVAKLPNILRVVIAKTIEKHHRGGGKFNNDAGTQSKANGIAGQIKAIIDTAGVTDIDDLTPAAHAKFMSLQKQLSGMGYMYDYTVGDGIAQSSAGGMSPNGNNFLDALESIF